MVCFCEWKATDKYLFLKLFVFNMKFFTIFVMPKTKKMKIRSIHTQHTPPYGLNQRGLSFSLIGTDFVSGGFLILKNV